MGKEQDFISYASGVKRKTSGTGAIVWSVTLFMLAVLVIDALVVLDRGWVPWEWYERMSALGSGGGCIAILAAAGLSIELPLSNFERTLLLLSGFVCFIAGMLVPSFAHA